MKKQNLLVGLDIGTTKVACLVAESRQDSIEIIGVGHAESKGMKRGVVIDLGAVVQSITKAVQAAENMCGREIEDVFTGISGSHIMGIHESGMIVIQNPEITQEDIRRVVDAAQTVPIPPEQEILTIVPLDFTVDGTSGIKEPIGMTGKRLEARVHIITASVSSAMNITRCCNNVGLNVSDIILQPMASATAVLTPDEMDLGVAMIDIGGGTTDVAVYQDGALRHTHVLSIGGNQFTNDLAIGLRAASNEAKRIKEQHGCVHPNMVQKDEEVAVPAVGGQGENNVKRTVLTEILGPRAQEIFMMVRHDLERSGWYGKIPSGIVLTGGGSMLQGMEALASEIFELPVRLGAPRGVGGLADVVRNPSYATAVGLLVHGRAVGGDTRYQIKNENQLGKLLARMKSWFQDIFE